MNLAEPLLPVASPTPATPAGASGSGGVGFGIGSGAIGGARRVLGIVQEYVEALGASLGVESEEEARACVWLGLQAHLANAVFTIGRNIGPAMFIAKAGAAQLPIVMFISGFSVIGIGPVFAKWSKGKRAAKVNYEFCLLSAALLLLLPLPIAMSTPGSALGIAAAYMLFLAEDLLPMLLMMQSSSLAQGSLTGHAAKRLLGLIQLGCSTGAMTAGLAIAPLVRTFGSTALLFVQVLLLLASLWPNHMAWWYEDFDEGREGKKKEVQDASAAPTTSPAGPQKADDSQRAAQQPIYRSPMIVALAINTFGIIFCKTIVEYQYNVLLASVLSTDEMVAMTGQLYAAAGFSASVLNVFNSPMMRALGITTTLLICPVSLCVSALAFAAVPLVWAAFLGRLVDLTLRWSINNSTKSLLWIATPREMQVRAKPIIEGTVKKMTGSCTAFCIGVVSVILVGDHKLRALALLSAAVAAASSVVCASSGRMYHAAMWAQIDRRELVLDEDADRARQYGSSGLVDFEGTIEIDPVMAAMVLEKLQSAPPQVQLYILRGMGERLPDAAWRTFLESPLTGFESLAPEVQVEVIRLCEKAPARFSHRRLLDFVRHRLDYEESPPARGAGLTRAEVADKYQTERATAYAILATGTRRLMDAKPLLARLLESRKASLRGAAAAALLRLGWGVGLGSLTTTAISVLEQLCGVSLGDEELLSLPKLASRQASHKEASLHRTPKKAKPAEKAEALELEVAQLTAEWEELAAREPGPAMAIALRLTRLKGRLAAARAAAAASPHDALATAGGASPPDGGFGAREADQRVGINMLRALPEEILPTESLLTLLHAESHSVRRAALPLLRPFLADSPRLEELLQAAIACAEDSYTSHRAKVALAGLIAHGGDYVGGLALQIAEERLRQVISEARTSSSGGRESEIGLSTSPSASYAGAIRVRGICELLLGCDTTGALSGSLLELSASLHDPEVVHELLDALLHLWSRRPAGARNDALDDEVHAQAKNLLRGFAVVQWLQAPSPPPLPRDLSSHLADALGLDLDRAGPAPAAALRELAVDYTRERLYLQRLRLFKLSMLWASPVGGGIAPSKVYAAWRALRSDDVKAVSAALEVLDTTLPPKLSSLVMPLLNDAVALDKKLKLAAQVRDLRLPPGGVPSKPWIVQYFSESGDPLGQDLGGLCGWLSVATGRGGAAQLIQARARTRQAQRSASPVAAVEASASQYGSVGSQFGGSTAADAFESSTKVPESQIGGSVGPRRSMQRGSTHATASGSEMLLSVDPTKAIKRSISDEGPLDEERAARRAKSSEEAVESIGPPPTTGLAQRVLLLRSSRVFRGVLTLHVAAIGQRAVEVEVAEGDEFTRAGASYFLVEGAASRVRSDGGVKVYHSGETIQELGCIDEKLPVLPCRAEEASKLLVLRPGDVWSLMLRLPPKFALSLLRALVTFAPSRSHGGGKQPMRQSSVMGEAPRSVSPPAAGAPMLPPARDSAEVRISMPPESPAARARLTELAGGFGGDGGEALERSSLDAVEESPEEDFGEDVSGESELVAPEVEGEGDRPRERARIAFTREERAWLMRQVKLLRYVHRRFIPYLADIAVEARVSAGEIVCEQGQPTTPGLIIVACGKLELWRKPLRGGDPVLLRELTAGDSLGNTGLIADVHWEYTAVGKEDAWTLTIHRDDLANLLRGRAELSLSVLKGFYKTFVRRLRQVLEQEGGITDSWLLAADVDKSPIKSDRHRRDPFLGMAPPKELSASESAVALPLIPQ